MVEVWCLFGDRQLNKKEAVQRITKKRISRAARVIGCGGGVVFFFASPRSAVTPRLFNTDPRANERGPARPRATPVVTNFELAATGGP